MNDYYSLSNEHKLSRQLALNYYYHHNNKKKKTILLSLNYISNVQRVSREHP